MLESTGPLLAASSRRPKPPALAWLPLAAGPDRQPNRVEAGNRRSRCATALKARKVEPPSPPRPSKAHAEEAPRCRRPLSSLMPPKPAELKMGVLQALWLPGWGPGGGPCRSGDASTKPGLGDPTGSCLGLVLPRSAGVAAGAVRRISWAVAIERIARWNPSAHPSLQQVLHRKLDTPQSAAPGRSVCPSPAHPYLFGDGRPKRGLGACSYPSKQSLSGTFVRRQLHAGSSPPRWLAAVGWIRAGSPPISAASATAAGA